MTVAMLMQNTLKSAERLWSLARERKVVPLELELLEKVPRCVSSHFLFFSLSFFVFGTRAFYSLFRLDFMRIL